MGYQRISRDYGTNLLRIFNDQNKMDKFAAAFSRSMRKMEYEPCIADEIIPPKPITAEDCDLDERNTAGGKVVIHREYTGARAIQVGDRGLANMRYLETDAFAIYGFKIETDTVKMREREIRHLRIPFKEQVQRQCLYQLTRQKDAYFLGLVELALNDNPDQRIKSPNTSVTLEDLNRLKNVIHNRSMGDGLHLTPKTFLMTESQYNNLSLLVQNNLSDGPGTGAGMAGGITQEFWRDGYKYDHILGCRIVTTKKVDLFPPNRIYCFCDPDVMAYNLTWNQSRFMMKRDWDMYEFKAIDDLWMGWGNTYAVASIELREDVSI